MAALASSFARPKAAALRDEGTSERPGRQRRAAAPRRTSPGKDIRTRSPEPKWLLLPLKLFISSSSTSPNRHRQNFKSRQLVLGCITTKFNNSTLILQHCFQAMQNLSHAFFIILKLLALLQIIAHFYRPPRNFAKIQSSQLRRTFCGISLEFRRNPRIIKANRILLQFSRDYAES